MAALSEYLLMNSDFTDNLKHAQSFVKLLFNANFRSLYCWDKKDITNRRKRFNYRLINSLPESVKSFIGQERAKHIRYLAVNVATGDPKDKVVLYDPEKWIGKVRKMFTLASGELHSKSIKVRHYYLIL